MKSGLVEPGLVLVEWSMAFRVSQKQKEMSRGAMTDGSWGGAKRRRRVYRSKGVSRADRRGQFPFRMW